MFVSNHLISKFYKEKFVSKIKYFQELNLYQLEKEFKNDLFN